MELFNHAGIFGKLTLLVGLVPLFVAILYVVRPTERTLAFMRPVSLSAMFAGLSGTAVGFISVLQGLAASSNPEMSRAYMGLSETFGPAFVNFGFLAAAWLLVAGGMLRRTP